ncbi:MAG: RNA methyltransferase [Candidatus Eiseniibacteriota bacterium]
MAGTDRTKKSEMTLPQGGPAIVLVTSQLGENIGASARAMLNCGLADLRLVRPRDGWPNDYAIKAASGADAVLQGAEVFAATKAAIADLQRVYATTARPRDLVKRVIGPREAAAEMRAAVAAGERVGVLFGPERMGLHNDDVTLADTIIEVPLNPAFSSLNLAQAVLIVAYEWRMAGGAVPLGDGLMPTGIARPATREELIGFFEHLEAELDDCGFLRPPEKRPAMVRNIRNLFQRAGLTDQEVRTLRGIVTGLSNWRADGTKRKRGD